MRALERQLMERAATVACEILEVSRSAVRVPKNPDVGIDLFVRAAGLTFGVDVRSSATPGRLAERAGRPAGAASKHIPLLAVPFMTETGKRACEAAGLAWFDLSGNAHIRAPGLRIRIEGRPNRSPRRGRPASTFAPKSARVTRWLLIHEGRATTQRQIANETGMTEGFVSRITGRLDEDGYLVRSKEGLRVKNPDTLLDAWREEYRFDKHTIIQGHVAARSGDALTRLVSDSLQAQEIEHAATGLSAAWQLTRFAAFRVATFFVDDVPSAQLKKRLGFREGESGANLWLVVPNDEGVFAGAESREGVRCVHPVQAYVDLKAHPERAPEAAEHLRAELLRWGRRG